METQNTTRTKEDKDFISKIRRENNKRYPVVMKNKKLGRLYIIYSNRVESYGLEKEENKKELDDSFKDCEPEGWSPYIEIEMARGSGFKRVQDTTNKDDWRFN